MMTSPWDDHIKLAVRCWAVDRARQLREEAAKVPAHELEHFLAAVLTDALLTFNHTYNTAMNEQIHLLERRLEELVNHLPIPSITIPAKAKGEL